MRKFFAILFTLLFVVSVTACGAGTASDVTAKFSGSSYETDKEGYVVIKGIADLTPHSELIEFVEPTLEEQGIKIDLVMDTTDGTENERLASGEIDFNFCQHVPYLEEYNEINGTNLVSAGDIHVEPIAAYSEKYDSIDEIPDNATIVIPNDLTNEYRALTILENAGFIKLSSDLEGLKAEVSDIEEYIKPVTITEIASEQIINLAGDFDVYITNTNKAIEAGIDTTKYLFRESSDSPYANIITVRAGEETDPAIQALVEALKSDETKKFIEDNYNGAVIPVE